MNTRPHRSPSGLTLVELVLALSLLAVVLIATTTVLAATFRAWRLAVQQVEEQQNARLALEWMVRRLRQVGPAALTSAEAESVGFKADFGGADRHRFCLDRGRWVVRHQSGADVTSTGCGRGAPITTPGGEALPHVVSLEFTYFDGADNVLPVPLDASDLALVRRVRIALSTGMIERPEASSLLNLSAEVALRGRR
jgi:Tfp pilus assembly protein PilW